MRVLEVFEVFQRFLLCLSVLGAVLYGFRGGQWFEVLCVLLTKEAMLGTYRASNLDLSTVLKMSIGALRPEMCSRNRPRIGNGILEIVNHMLSLS